MGSIGSTHCCAGAPLVISPFKVSVPSLERPSTAPDSNFYISVCRGGQQVRWSSARTRVIDEERLVEKRSVIFDP